ncbi:MAG: ABC transporter ATP-binding protein/permease [Clostridiales bacterium]|nr:ABC transporter ATP-binding protein/permease [Clostridiales bacterium]MDY4060247.1 ABC transporter ATP-binding protein/permease [Anaerovoracaceae bacterium]
MIRLENVNKYFNRLKKNEIHVINNTSLEIAGPGLVAILGPSGCGKTTLLNAIGGLDNVSTGKIFVNNRRLTGRTVWAKDKIRNLNIGYIFQNYNLVDNMSVFDNVALVLKMQGVKDKEEIKDKVHYALEMVGMYRYRNRYADMLSGGERQRVGIARAIVKNPAIVIADEPTGNLDSRNTLEVMNIIKTISKTKLVLMVTHEEKLANFYASRIIRLRDGSVVSDEINTNESNLDYRIDDKIYLGDVQNHQEVSIYGSKINIYQEDEQIADMDIVIKNGNVYVRVKDENLRTEIVDEHSSVEFVDDKYREISKDDYKESGYDMTKLEARKPPRNASIINLWSMITKGFSQVANYPIMKKILLFGFFISAMFIMYSISNTAAVLNTPDERFVDTNHHYLIVKNKGMSSDQYSKLESIAAENKGYVIPGKSKITLPIIYKNYLQTGINMGEKISVSMTDINAIKYKDLIAGKMPEASNEVVVDKLAFKKLFEEGGYATQAGLFKGEDFVGMTFNLDEYVNLKITGIVDKSSPSMYVDLGQTDNILFALKNSTGKTDMENAPGTQSEDTVITKELADNAAPDSLMLKSGRWPESDYEVVISYDKRFDHGIGTLVTPKINQQKLKVVGYYTDEYNRGLAIVTPGTLKMQVRNDETGAALYLPRLSDKAAVMDQLRSEGFESFDAYKNAKDKYTDDMRKTMKTVLIMGFVILAISLIEIYLMMRASFLSRIKEVGVFRAIGVKKTDIYKMFLGEVIAITTIAGIPGFVLMGYIVYKLSQINTFQYTFLMNPTVAIIAIVIIYAANILFGLLPVILVLFKTPAAILARTDVD